MDTPLTINDWLDAMVVSLDELATTMLGQTGATMVDTFDQIPQGGNAAYISIVGDHSAVQIGVGTSPQNCQLLAKALMGMEPDEEDLEPDEMTDAFSEITNIVAGQVKTIIGKKRNVKVNLGIPMFIKGELSVPEYSEVKVADARIGGTPVTLLVMKSRDMV